MAKGPFKMRSGNVTPFKEMGSTAVKHTTLSDHEHGPGGEIIKKSIFGTSTSLGKHDSKTKEEVKADKLTKKVLADTDNQIILKKKKSIEDRLASVKERDIALREKKYEESKTSKKTGPSIEQQLADRKLEELKTAKNKLYSEGKRKVGVLER